MSKAVQFGTCSWKFPSWEGLVYSAGDGINYLAEYARAFNTVEVDQWFWSLFGLDTVSLPKPETVAEYLSSVPGTFRFSIKAPNSITLTHVYKRSRKDPNALNPHFLSPELTSRFLSLIEPMREHTSVVMFQFEYLNKQKMRDRASFLSHLDGFFSSLPGGWTYGLEPRNPQYLERDYFELLRRHGISHVFCQGYYMPPLQRIYPQVADLLISPVVIRLMGPDRAEIERKTGKRWDAAVDPKDEDLAGIADVVEDMLARGQQVIVNVNNHYEGSAPITIRKLRDLL
ncbi:MAG: DUF72 domain-containing protein [Spirochaetes bacterium]|jgi:uncharacterized protein YecE (DUF72 family)|nr:DUF72 domain-containing protein [Spirochaetota bacterium]